MKIKYSKKSLKFLAKHDKQTVERIVRAWDPDYSKLTLKEAENSGYIDEEDIDWNNLEKYG